MSRGKFITFEGPEGSGKSTQIRYALAWIHRFGIRARLVREPGGTRLGERVRKVLMTWRGDMAPEAELFLFLAARAQLSGDVIEPALRKGITILADRFGDSTVAYQGYASGLSRGALRVCAKMAARALVPDLTFIFDVETRRGLARSGRRDRVERKSLAFHLRVRAGYRMICKQEPKRVVWVPEGSRPVVRAQVEKRLCKLFSKR